MEKKILGIFVCTLLIAVAVLPVTGIKNYNNRNLSFGIISKEEKLIEDSGISQSKMWLANPEFFPGGGTPDTLFGFNVEYWNPYMVWPIPYFEPDQPDVPNNGQNDMHVRKAIDSEDQVHVVWMREVGQNQWEIWYLEMHGNGVIIVPPKQISDNDNASSVYPSIALDSEDNAHVVWSDLRKIYCSEIYYSKIIDDAGTDLHIPDFPISDLDGFNSGRVVLPPLDDRIASYIEHPDIDVSPDDAVDIVWSDERDGNWEVYYQKQSTATTPVIFWNDVLISDNDNCNSQCPVVASDFEERVHIAWQDNRSFYENWEIYYELWTPTGSIQNDKLVSHIGGYGDRYNSAKPDIDVTLELVEHMSGNVHIVFMDQRLEDPWIQQYAWQIRPDHKFDYGNNQPYWEVYKVTLDMNGDFRHQEPFRDFGWFGPKRESDMTGANTWYGSYTGEPDGYSMYPRIVVEDDLLPRDTWGWDHIKWHDDRNDSWDIFHSVLCSDCENPNEDIQVTFDIGDDMYPDVALNQSWEPDNKWQSDRDGNWKIFDARRELDQWIQITVRDDDTSAVHSSDMFRYDPYDLNATDGILYHVGLFLPVGEYSFKISACDSTGNVSSTEWITGPVVVPDVDPPVVEITRPKGIYLFDKEIIPWPFDFLPSLVIGPIEVNVIANDSGDGILSRVEYYLEKSDEWIVLWDNDLDGDFDYYEEEVAFGKKKLQVRAIDNAGNENLVEM